MKIAKFTATKFVFKIAKREKPLLMRILKLHSKIPPYRSRRRKGANLGALREADQLLAESLVSSVRESRLLLRAMLKDPKIFRETHACFRLCLDRDQANCFLQVLNHIRIGCWRQLGCPELNTTRVPVTQQTVHFYWAMEVCGAFEMILLRALDQAV